MKIRLILALLLFLPAAAAAQESYEEWKDRARDWRDSQEWSLYGSYNGLVFDDEVYEEIMDKDWLPMVRFGWGWYPVENLALESAAGLMYEKSASVGSLSGEPSDEEFELWVIPVEIDVRYRFKFLADQLLVPSAWVGYDWWYFKEDNDFADDIEGDKTGYHYGIELGLLLDPLDKPAAHVMKRDYRVNDTYLCFGWERVEMEEEGLNFSSDRYSVSLRFDLGPPPAP